MQTLWCKFGLSLSPPVDGIMGIEFATRRTRKCIRSPILQHPSFIFSSSTLEGVSSSSSSSFEPATNSRRWEQTQVRGEGGGHPPPLLPLSLSLAAGLSPGGLVGMRAGRSTKLKTKAERTARGARRRASLSPSHHDCSRSAYPDLQHD